MKKIWNKINRRVNLKWYIGISTVVAIFVSLTDNYNWWEAAIFGFIFFILISCLAYVQHVQDEKHAKYIEDRYSDDPEWTKYKQLKKKFKNS